MKLSSVVKIITQSQVTHPRRFLVAGGLLSIAALAVASMLRFDASYVALLPEDSPQLRNVDEIREQIGYTRQVVVAISGGDPETRLDFSRHLAQRLEGLEGVRWVDVELPAEFIRERGLWLVDDETFEELSGALESALSLAKERGDTRGLRVVAGRVRDALEDQQQWLRGDGILQSRDGRFTFVVIVPSISFYQYDEAGALLERIREEAESLEPDTSGLELRYAGNLYVVQEHQAQMKTDLRNASLVALVLGILIIAVFTRRPFAPLVIGLTLIAGVAWTFGVAYFIVGRLNIITGFLVAVLIGLGIDFSIHLYVRFRQEASGRDSVAEAVTKAVIGTLPPALTSALTTAGTFFTFSLGDFRGFSEFGMIAGVGVMLTFVSTFALLPPLLVLFGKPGPKRSIARRSRKRGFTVSVPTLRISLIIVLLFLGVAVIGAASVSILPFRNDFAALRGRSETVDFTEYVDRNLGAGFNPAILVVDQLDEARHVAEIARQRASETKQTGDVRIGRVLAITDMLPRDIEHRGAEIARLRRILRDPAFDDISEREPEAAELLSAGRELLAATPWTVDEIPEALRRRFVGREGQRFLVYVWPNEMTVTDAQALAWEEELGELQSRIGAVGVGARVLDETLIIGWVSRMVASDGPRLLALAAIVVLFFLLIDLRSIRRTALVALPLFVSMLVLVAALRALSFELNMFNMVVIPSIIGIGIDNAVHIYHRYQREGAGSVLAVVRRTGVAVSLASLTTAVGFGSSLISHHAGLRSLGLLAIVGIFSALLAAVIFFPALLVLLEKKKAQ